MAATRSRTITPPTEQPITVDELKAHLNITDTSQDAYLTSLILQAVDYAERLLGYYFCKREVETYYDFADDKWIAEQRRINKTKSDFFKNRRLELPILPVHSATSVELMDIDGTATTLDPASYTVDAISQFLPGRILLKDDTTLPSVDLRMYLSSTVQYFVGYDSGEVPPAAKNGLLRLAGYMYENRGDCCDACSLNQVIMSSLGIFKATKI